MRASVVVACGLSSCGSRALERRLSSCGSWAYLLHGMWDLPGPGIEPVSPALAGGFLTTAPPGKSGGSFLTSSLLFLEPFREGTGITRPWEAWCQTQCQVWLCHFFDPCPLVCFCLLNGDEQMHAIYARTQQAIECKKVYKL